MIIYCSMFQLFYTNEKRNEIIIEQKLIWYCKLFKVFNYKFLLLFLLLNSTSKFNWKKKFGSNLVRLENISSSSLSTTSSWSLPKTTAEGNKYWEKLFLQIKIIINRYEINNLQMKNMSKQNGNFYWKISIQNREPFSIRFVYSVYSIEIHI